MKYEEHEGNDFSVINPAKYIAENANIQNCLMDAIIKRKSNPRKFQFGNFLLFINFIKNLNNYIYYTFLAFKYKIHTILHKY